MTAGLSVKEKNILKLALTLTLAFSPPKSLSDAGGGLCGLKADHYYQRYTVISLILFHAAGSSNAKGWRDPSEKRTKD